MTNLDRVLVGLCFAGLVVHSLELATVLASGYLVGTGIAGGIRWVWDALSRGEQS